MGSKRNDSSTIRATPSASGEARIIRNFSNSSSARSEEGNRPDAAFEAGGVPHRCHHRELVVGWHSGRLEQVLQRNTQRSRNSP